MVGHKSLEGAYTKKHTHKKKKIVCRVNDPLEVNVPFAMYHNIAVVHASNLFVIITFI